MGGEMAVELPRDAEGREVPLDTETLYDETGGGHEVYYYKYSVRRAAPRRKWQVVVTDYAVHDVSDLYLTPPDSWGKLLGDLKAAGGCGGSPHPDNPVCHYLGMAGKPCDECKFHGRADCIGEMCADIAYRIRGLGVGANG